MESLHVEEELFDEVTGDAVGASVEELLHHDGGEFELLQMVVLIQSYYEI